jgi:hypothetical protein
LNWVFAAGTFLEAIAVIAFTLSFSTLLAYSAMSFVIWIMQPRQYNEADASSSSFALSRRLLGAHLLDRSAGRSAAGNRSRGAELG